MYGRVHWWNRKKGYGFIISEEGTDVFVHYTALVGDRNLEKGEYVEFRVEQGYKGLKAVNVRKKDGSRDSTKNN